MKRKSDRVGEVLPSHKRHFSSAECCADANEGDGRFENAAEFWHDTGGERTAEDDGVTAVALEAVMPSWTQEDRYDPENHIMDAAEFWAETTEDVCTDTATGEHVVVADRRDVCRSSGGDGDVTKSLSHSEMALCLGHEPYDPHNHIADADEFWADTTRDKATINASLDGGTCSGCLGAQDGGAHVAPAPMPMPMHFESSDDFWAGADDMET